MKWVYMILQDNGGMVVQDNRVTVGVGCLHLCRLRQRRGEMLGAGLCSLSWKTWIKLLKFSLSSN